MVASGRFDGADAAGEAPVLECRVADADFVRGLAGREQGGRGQELSKYPLASTLHALITGPVPDWGFAGKPCDCSHSTVANTDDSLPVAFP